MPSPDWPRLMRTLWNEKRNYTSVKVEKVLDRLRTWSGKRTWTTVDDASQECEKGRMEKYT